MWESNKIFVRCLRNCWTECWTLLMFIPKKNFAWHSCLCYWRYEIECKRDWIRMKTLLAYCAWPETSSVKVTREKGEKYTAQPVREARRSIEGNGRGEAVTSRRYGNCLTASKQGACTAQPVLAARRLIEGNGRGEIVTSRRYGTRNRITSQA
jgi:hypothetical protein